MDADSIKRKSKLKLITDINQLTQRERLVLSLYYLDDLTFIEIGIVLRMHERQVWTIFADAIGQLLNIMLSPKEISN